MHTGTDDLLDEQTKGLAELAEHLRTTQVAAARKAAIKSAARVRSLNGRVRDLARSGVRLTSISHGTAKSLIELQAEIVDSALNDAAAQIERIAYTGSVRDLARDQAEVLKSARERIADDLTRTLTILRQAAHEVRHVAEPEPAAPAARKKSTARKGSKPAARKAAKSTTRKAAKSTVRKAKRVVRKSKRKVKATSRKTARRRRST